MSFELSFEGWVGIYQSIAYNLTEWIFSGYFSLQELIKILSEFTDKIT